MKYYVGLSFIRPKRNENVLLLIISVGEQMICRHESIEGERTLAMRILFDKILGDATPGDNIPPPNTMGDITSGQSTRGLRIRGLST